MFRNPLVNVDGSASARAALGCAIELTRVSGGRIGVLCAVPPANVSIAAALYALPVCRRQLNEQLQAAAQRSVEEAAGAIPAEVPVTRLVVRATPTEALLTNARDGFWDVVIVGDRLVGRSWPFAYGAARLLRSSPVPVLVVSGDSMRALPPGDLRGTRGSSRRDGQCESASTRPGTPTAFGGQPESPQLTETASASGLSRVGSAAVRDRVWPR